MPARCTDVWYSAFDLLSVSDMVRPIEEVHSDPIVHVISKEYYFIGILFLLTFLCAGQFTDLTKMGVILRR